MSSSDRVPFGLKENVAHKPTPGRRAQPLALIGIEPTSKRCEVTGLVRSGHPLLLLRPMDTSELSTAGLHLHNIL